MSRMPLIDLNTVKVWPIGTKYKTKGKYPRLCTVIDILRTYDKDDRLVKISYISTHDFLGCTTYNRDVCAATIAIGEVK